MAGMFDDGWFWLWSFVCFGFGCVVGHWMGYHFGRWSVMKERADKLEAELQRRSVR